ncbi:hypothetical protein ACGF0D_40425 [Kitasatospora sp. NPDC048298]|uniref:hypothetical protein n=1 Tax=Kitasatospora sp. NPDC048298 TaxID=3364049 RepID=UPI00371980C7
MKFSTIRARVLAPTVLLAAVIAPLLTHGHTPALGAELTADDRWGLARFSHIGQMDDRWGAGRNDIRAMDDRWGAGRHDIRAMDDRWGAGRHDAGPGDAAQAAPVRIRTV